MAILFRILHYILYIITNPDSVWGSYLTVSQLPERDKGIDVAATYDLHNYISSNIHLIAELHSIRYSWLFPRKLLLKHTFHHQYYPYHRIMPALSHDHDGFQEFPNSLLPFSKKHTTFFPKAYYLFINSIVPILKSNHSFSCNAKCFS